MTINGGRTPFFTSATLGLAAGLVPLSPVSAASTAPTTNGSSRSASSPMKLSQVRYGDTITSRSGVMSVRAVVHMIEEYVQHNRHADLIRERIDGTTDK